MDLQYLPLHTRNTRTHAALTRPSYTLATSYSTTSPLTGLASAASTARSSSTRSSTSELILSAFPIMELIITLTVLLVRTPQRPTKVTLLLDLQRPFTVVRRAGTRVSPGYSQLHSKDLIGSLARAQLRTVLGHRRRRAILRIKPALC